MSKVLNDNKGAHDDARVIECFSGLGFGTRTDLFEMIQMVSGSLKLNNYSDTVNNTFLETLDCFLEGALKYPPSSAFSSLNTWLNKPNHASMDKFSESIVKLIDNAFEGKSSGDAKFGISRALPARMTLVGCGDVAILGSIYTEGNGALSSLPKYTQELLRKGKFTPRLDVKTRKVFWENDLTEDFTFTFERLAPAIGIHKRFGLTKFATADFELSLDNFDSLDKLQTGVYDIAPRGAPMNTRAKGSEVDTLSWRIYGGDEPSTKRILREYLKRPERFLRKGVIVARLHIMWGWKNSVVQFGVTKVDFIHEPVNAVIPSHIYELPPRAFKLQISKLNANYLSTLQSRKLYHMIGKLLPLRTKAPHEVIRVLGILVCILRSRVSVGTPTQREVYDHTSWADEASDSDTDEMPDERIRVLNFKHGFDTFRAVENIAYVTPLRLIVEDEPYSLSINQRIHSLEDIPLQHPKQIFEAGGYPLDHGVVFVTPHGGEFAYQVMCARGCEWGGGYHLLRGFVHTLVSRYSGDQPSNALARQLSLLIPGFLPDDVREKYSTTEFAFSKRSWAAVERINVNLHKVIEEQVVIAREEEKVIKEQLRIAALVQRERRLIERELLEEFNAKQMERLAVRARAEEWFSSREEKHHGRAFFRLRDLIEGKSKYTSKDFAKANRLSRGKRKEKMSTMRNEQRLWYSNIVTMNADELRRVANTAINSLIDFRVTKASKPDIIYIKKFVAKQLMEWDANQARKFFYALKKSFEFDLSMDIHIHKELWLQRNADNPLLEEYPGVDEAFIEKCRHKAGRNVLRQVRTAIVEQFGFRVETPKAETETVPENPQIWDMPVARDLNDGWD
jgi:hypothetical protein